MLEFEISSWSAGNLGARRQTARIAQVAQQMANLTWAYNNCPFALTVIMKHGDGMNVECPMVQNCIAARLSGKRMRCQKQAGELNNILIYYATAREWPDPGKLREENEPIIFKIQTNGRLKGSNKFR